MNRRITGGAVPLTEFLTHGLLLALLAQNGFGLASPRLPLTPHKFLQGAATIAPAHIRADVLLPAVVFKQVCVNHGAVSARSQADFDAGSSNFDFQYFSQTKVFYFAVAFALLLIAAALVRYRIKQIRRREYELEALVAERTQEIEEAREQLELRVHVRTAALKKTNDKLQTEILERERAKNEILRLNEELEQRVADRTSALQESESKFRRLAEELEKLVAERTARIQELERQRAESEKLAATGRMAARIAHEINNPLAGIKNSFLLIKNAIPPAHQHYAYVSRIEKEIERIARIVRQMFPLYRRDQYEPREFRADEMIRDLVIILETNRREKQIRFEVDAERAQETLCMPEGLLKQVLYNLIQNAFEASPSQGAIAVTAAITNKFLTITVADQGPGIPEEARPHIFEPFFTTKDGLNTGGGVGLGLSVSKNIIEALRGTLDFETALGQGTRFRVCLPCETASNHVPSVEINQMDGVDFDGE